MKRENQMKIGRMFFNDNYKGTRDYLKTQKNYEIARTVLYFIISGSLFAAGWISTGSRENLLTIVAVLGCLPACKSAVDMILYLRYKGCSNENADKIACHAQGLPALYDVVFTSSEKVMHLDCIYVTGHQIIGYTSRAKDNVQIIQEYLKKECKLRGISYAVYIVTQEKQITDRMKLRGGESADVNTEAKEEVLSMLRTFTV